MPQTTEREYADFLIEFSILSILHLREEKERGKK